MDAVDEPGVGRIRHDHLVADFDGSEERVQNAGQPAGRDDAVPLAGIGHAGHARDVGRRSLAQAQLAHERQIAVVGVGGRGLLRAGNRSLVRRNVDVQILQAQQVASCRVRGRPDAIDSDPGDVFQSCWPAPETHDSSLYSCVLPKK